MKKILIIPFIVITSLLITACSQDNKPQKNTMQQTQLTQNEIILMQISSENFQSFDYHVDANKKYIRIWAERYRNGKLESKKLINTSSSINKKGTIAIAIQKENDLRNKILVIIASEDGYSSFNGEMEVDIKDYSTVSSFNSNKPILIDGEIILGGIGYDNGDKLSSHSLPQGYFENPKEYPDALDDYDIIDIFKCEFRKTYEEIEQKEAKN